MKTPNPKNKPKKALSKIPSKSLSKQKESFFKKSSLPSSRSSSSSALPYLPPKEKLSDPLFKYLQEIGRHPTLSREEEHRLAIEYSQTQSAETAKKLISSNLKFVVKVAAEYAKFGGQLIDLIQEGNVGLMHALKEFDPHRGVRLITYAVWWIRGYIQDYIMKQHSLVKIGTTQRQKKLFYHLRKEQERLKKMGVLGNQHLLISSRLGVDPQSVASMDQRLQQRDISLDQPLFKNGGDSTTSLLDQQVDPSSLPPEELLGRSQEMKLLKEKIEEIRPHLNEREIFLLEKRLLAEFPLTLQKVGERYNITREAVRQSESRLIQKLRKSFFDVNKKPNKNKI